jgi:hypothetical protein
MADTAGALGYHDLTHDGQPISKVFVKTTIKDGELVSVTACHELFEMVIDAIANLWAEVHRRWCSSVKFRAPGLVRAVQASAGHEI